MKYKNKIVGDGKRFVNQFKKKLQHKVCTTKLLDEDDDPQLILDDLQYLVMMM